MRCRGGAASYLEVLTNETNYFSAELGLAQLQSNETVNSPTNYQDMVRLDTASRCSRYTTSALWTHEPPAFHFPSTDLRNSFLYPNFASGIKFGAARYIATTGKER
jgi:hypothetical protein